MSAAKTNKFLRYLTLNFQSTIDIALIGLGLFSIFTAICGAVMTSWSDSLAIAWSISFSIKVLAGAAMIGATICSIGATGRIISALAIGYCVCLLAYLNRIDVQAFVGVIVLLAILVEAFVSRRVDLRTSNLTDRLERNALRVYRLVAIPTAPFVILLAVGLFSMFRPAIETFTWHEAEAHLVLTNSTADQLTSLNHRYRFNVDGKSYLLLESDDPEAANSAFALIHKGNASRRSREQPESTSADNTGETVPQAVVEQRPAPQKSIAIVYNPSSPSENALPLDLTAMRLIFGFFLIVFVLFCYPTYMLLNGSRLQFIEPSPKFWAKKPYVKIADLPATASQNKVSLSQTPEASP